MPHHGCEFVRIAVFKLPKYKKKKKNDDKLALHDLKNMSPLPFVHFWRGGGHILYFAVLLLCVRIELSKQ